MSRHIGRKIGNFTKHVFVNLYFYFNNIFNMIYDSALFLCPYFMDTFLCVQILWTPSYVSRFYGHLPMCPDSMDTFLCVQILWTPSYVSRFYGHLPMCPDSMDTFLCVQILWTPSYVSRFYGHLPMCPDSMDALQIAKSINRLDLPRLIIMQVKAYVKCLII